MVQTVKNLPAMQETWVQSLGWEKEMATHSSILAWTSPWTEEPGGLQSMEFSRPGYWSGLLCPSPGDPPNPGIEPRSPILQAVSLPAEPQGQDTAPLISFLLRQECKEVSNQSVKETGMEQEGRKDFGP